MKRFSFYLTLIFTFLLGSRDGFIALWNSCDPEPDQVFPYSIASLPPADRAKLEKGIRIHSREELNRLLEDYLS